MKPMVGARRVAAAMHPTARPTQLVLVVDDDDTARRFLLRAIRRGGLDVAEASSGQQALAQIAARRPDLVLLDSQMPEMSGEQVLKALREDPRTSTLPIIVVTGRGGVQDRVAGLDAGADDLVAKPVHPDELLARVRAQLRGSAAWTDVVEHRWQARNEVVTALGTISTDGPAAETAESMCRELRRLGACSFAGVLAVDTEGVVPLATLDVHDPKLRPGVPLPHRVARKLLRRAERGPWTEPAASPWAGACRPDDRGDAIACFAPIVFGTDLVGLVVLGVARAGNRRPSTDRAGTGPSTTLATAIDVAAAASGLLGSRLVAPDAAAARRRELVHAIEIGAFVPVFQPVVTLADRRTVGFEALTRFTDGSSPEQRFTDALALDLAIDLETATLARSVAAAEQLPAGPWLSLNASARLIGAPGTLPTLLGTSTRSIVLELTERERVDDYALLLEALREVGPNVQLAVDDAGAGYASLRHILALEPAYIKLDLSWVRLLDRDPARQALVAGLRHFSGGIGCSLIAEGVEREEEATALIELGVEYAQGFLFGEPGPVERWAD